MGGLLLTNGKSINVDDDLDKAISSVILGEYRQAHKKEYPGIYLGEGELPVEAHEILGKSIKNDKIEIYLMATYGDYEFQNDIFNLVHGSLQVPLKITFTTNEKEGRKLKDSNKYYFVDMEVASDGANLEKSIKDMFPKKEANKALNILKGTKESEKLLEEINQDATKYVESLGRKSKVTYHYVEKENIDESVLENIWKLEEIGKYPDYIGTREVIENKKRYIYETDYSKRSKVLCFTKIAENGGIVEEISYEIDNNKIKILLPSRLEMIQNRPQLILEALSYLDESERDKYQVIFTGFDVQYNKNIKILKNIAEENGINAKFVRFDHINEGYKVTDLVLVPSKSESFGYSALESLYVGIFTILSNIPTLREIATGTTNYFFFENNKDLAMILKNNVDKLRNERKEISKEWLKKYDLDLFARRYIDVINDGN